MSDFKQTLLYIYRNTSIGNLLHKFYWYPYQKIRASRQYIESIPRAVGYKDKRFTKLYNLKNKYQGKRCFVTCTGPSLTIEDLEKLSGEYVFGMNSIALIHDKTTWKPDFYGIQDVYVYEKIKNSIMSTDNGIVFVPMSYKKRFNTPDNWIYWHMCGAYHMYEYRFTDKLFVKITDNAYARVYDGYTITYSILQLAMYMGFEEIYLLGADCSYLGEKHHFIETERYDSKADTAGDRNIVAYLKAKEYADKHGVKIYNTTRGGCLEVFERKTLEEVLSVKEKNKTD